MNRRLLFALVVVVTSLVIGGIAIGAGSSSSTKAADAHRGNSSLPDGFEPAVLRAQNGLNRYFVVIDGPSVASRSKAGALSGRQQENAAAAARQSQTAAIAATRSLGGDVIFRYDTLIDGFSATLSPDAASQIAQRSDVSSVQPVSIVQKDNETSVPFIGATKVWHDFGARGQGMVVADVDTGIDYTHANFGGPGTVAAYNANDPNFIEPGTFPTKKVIGGYDFVGSNYGVARRRHDERHSAARCRSARRRDDDHGSHTSGTCCGIGVPGRDRPGRRPEVEAARDQGLGRGRLDRRRARRRLRARHGPEQRRRPDDAADVLTFSGGVDYGTANSVEARAAQRVVDLGTVFVAAAGNAGNQAVAAPRTSPARRPTLPA